MPRINRIGEFDWQFPDAMRPELRLNGACCLYFILSFDDNAWKEVGVNNYESIGYSLGRNQSPTQSGGLVSCFEEDTAILNSRAREIGRFISLQEWSTGVLVSYDCIHKQSAIYMVGTPYHAYSIPETLPSRSQLEIRYPTRFIEALVRKINKWAQNSELSTRGFVYNEKFLTHGKEIGRASVTNKEGLERAVIKASKLSKQQIRWFEKGIPDGTAGIFTVGANIEAAKEAIREFVLPE